MRKKRIRITESQLYHIIKQTLREEVDIKKYDNIWSVAIHSIEEGFDFIVKHKNDTNIIWKAINFEKAQGDELVIGEGKITINIEMALNYNFWVRFFNKKYPTFYLIEGQQQIPIANKKALYGFLDYWFDNAPMMVLEGYDETEEGVDKDEI